MPRTRAIIVAALRLAAACPDTAGGAVAVVVASVSTAGAAAASPRPVSARGGTDPGAVLRDHPAGRCRPTLRAGSLVLRASGPRRRVPGAVRCRGSSSGSIDFWHEELMGIGEIIEVDQPQPGTEKQGAQLARFGRGDILEGADLRAARNGQRKLASPSVGFAKFMIPNPPTMVPVSAL